MSDRINSELAALITPPPSTGVQFTQGRVISWDNELLGNQIEWRGITLTNVSLVEGISALTIREGDIVGMLGWAPENAKGVGSWWIIGKLSNPGEFVADLNITAKIFRLVTREGYPLAFFGDEADGDPLWILYYGGADEQSAFRILDGNDMLMQYRNGSLAMWISGESGSQIIRFFDQAGNEMFSTNGATGGVGMADPAMAYFVGPTGDAEQQGTTYLPATTSSSFRTIWRGYNRVYHPRISFGLTILATGTSEWQFRMNTGSGAVTLDSGSGSARNTVDVPGFGTTFTPGDEAEIIINARNTGGGVTHIGVDRLYGRQS
jgi:hypothetical protein